MIITVLRILVAPVVVAETVAHPLVAEVVTETAQVITQAIVVVAATVVVEEVVAVGEGVAAAVIDAWELT